MSLIVVGACMYVVVSSVVFVLVWALCRAAALADRGQAPVKPDEQVTSEPAPRRARGPLTERLSARALAVAHVIAPFRSHPR
jgi:hypothetical protein